MKNEQHFKMEKEGRGFPGFGRKTVLYNNIYVIQSREQRAEIPQSQLPRQGGREER